MPMVAVLAVVNCKHV